jgi:hypothetical protein
VVGIIPAGATVVARGRSEDNQWLFVDLPDSEQQGWVSASLVNVHGDVDSLIVSDPELTQYGPMQAFYLRNGEDQSTCVEAPNDGILVQTPEGVAEVRLWINEVKIRLGSTAYIQASPGEAMVLKTIEGKAVVEALGVEQDVVAGTTVSVPLNQDLHPVAPPTKPKPFDAAEVQSLPVQQMQEMATSTPVPTDTPTATNTDIPTATDTLTPTDTDTPVPTDTPTATDTDVPTNTPLPTDTPTQEPTNTEVPRDTDTPLPPNTEEPPPPTDQPPPSTQEPSPPPPTATSESETSGMPPPTATDSEPPPESTP